MRKSFLGLAGLSALSLSTITLPVYAYEAGDWLVRGRIINVNPNDSSGQLYINGVASGEGVSVNDDTVPELDITYMINRHWGLELILGYSEHTVKGVKNWNNLGDVAETKVLPPTLLLQYHFLPHSSIRPYIGAGINYTYFFDEEVPGILGTPGSKVKFDSSWGLAAQVGMDVAINDDWFINVDMKYIDIDTQAHYTNILGGTIERATINADIDPFVFGIGIGRRF